MATREQFELSKEERKKRRFSEDFKRQKVKEVERKQTTVLEVSKAYQVRANNVYKWIDKYSLKDKNGVRLVVEMESETKRVLALLQKVAELEPQITWFYDKKNKLKKETFDTSDAYVAARGYMNKIGAWKVN